QPLDEVASPVHDHPLVHRTGARVGRPQVLAGRRPGQELGYGCHPFRPTIARNRVCAGASGGTAISGPNTPAARNPPTCGSNTCRQASTSTGSSVASCPVPTARSQPWTSTSMNRCPAYTSPGTGPYETAHGASSAP